MAWLTDEDIRLMFSGALGMMVFGTSKKGILELYMLSNVVKYFPDE